MNWSASTILLAADSVREAASSAVVSVRTPCAWLGLWFWFWFQFNCNNNKQKQQQRQERLTGVLPTAMPFLLAATTSTLL